MASKIHVVYFGDGDYDEKRWGLVNSWRSKKLAEKHAAKLNEISSAYRDAKREFKPEPDLTDDEAKYDREWDQWNKDRTAMVDGFRVKMGLRVLDHYDEPRFSVDSIWHHER